MAVSRSSDSAPPHSDLSKKVTFHVAVGASVGTFAIPSLASLSSKRAPSYRDNFEHVETRKQTSPRLQRAPARVREAPIFSECLAPTSDHPGRRCTRGRASMS